MRIVPGGSAKGAYFRIGRRGAEDASLRYRIAAGQIQGQQVHLEYGLLARPEALCLAGKIGSGAHSTRSRNV